MKLIRINYDFPNFYTEIAAKDPHVKNYARIEQIITQLTKYFAVLILLTCYAILLTPVFIILLKKLAGETISREDYELPLKIVYVDDPNILLLVIENYKIHLLFSWYKVCHSIQPHRRDMKLHIFVQPFPSRAALFYKYRWTPSFSVHVYTFHNVLKMFKAKWNGWAFKWGENSLINWKHLLSITIPNVLCPIKINSNDEDALNKTLIELLHFYRQTIQWVHFKHQFSGDIVLKETFSKSIFELIRATLSAPIFIEFMSTIALLVAAFFQLSVISLQDTVRGFLTTFINQISGLRFIGLCS